MKQLTLNINESKFHIFLEFIKTPDYVEVAEPDMKSLSKFQNSLNQVKMMQGSKIEKQSASDFLDELLHISIPDFKRYFKIFLRKHPFIKSNMLDVVEIFRIFKVFGEKQN
ncbi:MAG: hypothetical protein PHW35_11640 [Lentimicrobiaceae bacterium]|jgi:hypothetical protein|nr:hypothetical protein [Lentimicrobiaceae bacterium]MDY0025257.1 hypothetical protein [Lentimicrobium sp.]